MSGKHLDVGFSDRFKAKGISGIEENCFSTLDRRSEIGRICVERCRDVGKRTVLH